MVIVLQVINGADVQEVLHNFPELNNYVHSLYDCQYDQFFQALSEFAWNVNGVWDLVFSGMRCLVSGNGALSPALSVADSISCTGAAWYCLCNSYAVWVEGELKSDRYLASHAHYYIREMRIKAFSQLLESYRSLSLQHMARTFGVSEVFIDRWVRLTSETTPMLRACFSRLCMRS